MSKKEQEEQLNMGLQEPISNKFKSLKYRIELFFVKIRTHSLFTAPFLWISLIFTLSLISTQYHYYINFVDKLPREIPLFLLANNPELRLVEKEALFFILIISLILTIISVAITLKIFYKSKFIAILTMVNLALSVSLLTFAYIKIIGMYIF